MKRRRRAARRICYIGVRSQPAPRDNISTSCSCPLPKHERCNHALIALSHEFAARFVFFASFRRVAQIAGTTFPLPNNLRTGGCTDLSQHTVWRSRRRARKTRRTEATSFRTTGLCPHGSTSLGCDHCLPCACFHRTWSGSVPAPGEAVW